MSGIGSFCSQALRRSINRNGSKVICVFHLVYRCSMEEVGKTYWINHSAHLHVRYGEVRWKEQLRAKICFECKKQLSLFQNSRKSNRAWTLSRAPCLKTCSNLATPFHRQDKLTHKQPECHSFSAAAVRKFHRQRRSPWQRPS